MVNAVDVIGGTLVLAFAALKLRPEVDTEGDARESERLADAAVVAQSVQ
jgi:hypothetical protein